MRRVLRTTVNIRLRCHCRVYGSSGGTKIGVNNGHEPPKWPVPKMMVVECDEDVQNPWKAMEARVNNRRSRRNGKRGRTGLKPTDEEHWAEAGLYDSAQKESKKNGP